MSETNPDIDALLVKYLLHEADAGEQETVARWRVTAPENEAYFVQFKTLWETSKTLAGTAQPDENAAWQLFQKRIHVPEQKVHFINRFRWIRVAALFVVIAGLAVVTYLQLRERPVPVLTAQSVDVVKIDTLPDGSVVTLNKHSAVTYPVKFNKGTRTVALKGEAFFNITPDKAKPFIIEVADVRITVVGTSFNVRSEGGTTEVIVATGVVQVQQGGKTVALHPNEKAVVRQKDSVLVKEAEPARLYNYYQSREFVCDNTPLWKLVDVLNRAYNANIVIEKAALRNLLLNATFSNESLDHILEVIRLTFAIQVERTGTAIILK